MPGDDHHERLLSPATKEPPLMPRTRIFDLPGANA